MQHQTVPQTREIPAHDIEPGMTVIDGVDGRLVVTARYADGADAILVSFADVPEPTRFGSGVTVLVAVADGEMTTATESTGLEHALAEILTAVNDNDPVGAYDDYDDCSADELHIHKQLNRIRDRITVIRAENDLPMDGADTAEQPKPDLRQRLAAELRRIADDIVAQQLPLGSYPSLRLGVVHSRADLDPWADYLSTTVDAPDSTDIPSVTAKVLLTDRRYGPELTIAVQSPKETSELERLRARNAELEAKLAEGGAAR